MSELKGEASENGICRRSYH